LADGNGGSMATYRLDRIEEEVKKELSTIISELKDPRISGVISVVAVNVTKDLRFAKAFISILGSSEQGENTLKGLNSAAGFIRKEIGHRLNLRNTPEFSFTEDSSIEYGAHINKLIRDVAVKSEETNEEGN